jgi:hypothetical protein
MNSNVQTPIPGKGHPSNYEGKKSQLNPRVNLLRRVGGLIILPRLTILVPLRCDTDASRNFVQTLDELHRKTLTDVPRNVTMNHLDRQLHGWKRDTHIPGLSRGNPITSQPPAGPELFGRVTTSLRAGLTRFRVGKSVA